MPSTFFLARTRVIIFTLLSVLCYSTQVNAEGFFSKLFGGSKNEASFETLLSHVPADTPYLLSNKNAIPEEVMEFHLKRGKDVLEMVSKAQKDEKDSADKKQSVSAFFEALMQDYSGLLADDKFDETGLDTKANSMLYGLDLMPVIRLGISDKEKIISMIKRAEEKSGHNIELKKCGEFNCFTSANKKGDASVAIIFLKNHIAAGVFPAIEKTKMIDHLMGKSKPTDTYSEKSWNTFLKANNYEGYGDGFINLKSIFDKAKPELTKEISKKVSSQEVEGCLAVVEAHLENIPEILFGTKKLEEKNMKYELLFNTSDSVSAIIQDIPNKTNIAKRSENAIFDIGINVNFPKLRDALTQYSNFLIESGKTHKCSAIKEKQIRKSMEGLALVMNMGLSQFNSLYASVTDLGFDDKMQPINIDAMLSIGANDPASLIAMLGMVNPAIMSFNVPEDGTTVKVPDSLLPPSRGQTIPDLFVNRTATELNIMLGNSKPALVEYEKDTPQISFSGMDGKRYLDKFSKIMKNIPNMKKENKDIKMLDNMSGLSGKVFTETTADKRGLVINYTLQY